MRASDSLFGDMFGGMSLDNYEERSVGKYSKDGVFVSTAAVYDSRFKFETAVAHPRYDLDDSLVIVENYMTKKDAILGHKKWVRKMTKGPLPKTLKDVGGSWVNSLLADQLIYKLRVSK